VSALGTQISPIDKPYMFRWEPLDSFNGSEHFVSGFWQRSSAGGRNVDDMTQFEAGETFHAVGPPSAFSIYFLRESDPFAA